MRVSNPHNNLLCVLLVTLALAATGCTMGYYEGYYDDAPYAGQYTDDYYVDEAEVLFEDFDELGYYGQWFELMPYGYVWRPTVVMDWQPFSNGHWIWTEYGWTWVSYEPFGWATSHYGFWAYDMVWGWIWIPDYEWHPARVEWAVFDDYIAWAPLPPRGFGVGSPWVDTRIHIWHVVHINDFTNADIGRYDRPRSEFKNLQGRSILKFKSPDATAIRTSTGRPIKQVLVGLEPVAADERYKRLALPEDEYKRLRQYRERTKKRFEPRPDVRQPVDSRQVPTDTDRIFKKRETRERDANRPAVKERPQTKRKNPPKAKSKERPQKQREKKQPEKREREKKKRDDGDRGKDAPKAKSKKKRG